MAAAALTRCAWASTRTRCTATIDLTGLTGQYRFNGSLLAINLRIDNIENIDGSVFSEFLGGDAGANVINGGAGNDTLEGRGGADTLNGGTGRDRARYDSSPAAVDIDLTRTSTTTAGQQIGGDAQGDRLSSIEDINGSQFGDLIRGNSAANDLVGNGGNDTLEGRAGEDTINGGAGVDTASYESSTAGVNVDLTRATQTGGHAQGDRLTSIERLIGSAFNDTLVGNSGNNFLTGGTGQDTLLGREGSDMLIGGFQNDVLDGGEGTDTASFESASTGVRVILGEGTAAGRTNHGITGEVDTLISIERAIGSNFADTFFGNSAENRFDGEDGDDVFLSSAGDDNYLGGDGIDTVDYGGEVVRSLQVTVSGFTFVTRAAVQGGLPNFFDTLIDVERVVGTNFGDTFTSGTAGTIFVGGGGNDVYNVSNSSVVILESAGRGFDTVFAEVDYSLLAGQHIERLSAASDAPLVLRGNEFDNEILGNDQNNTLVGGGVDRLVGFGGIDRYFVDNELDQVVDEPGGSFNDEVFCQDADFTLPSNVEILHVLGIGVAGTGNSANNLISGSSTDNLLDGAGGADSLFGFGGHDTFVLRRGEANGDNISDLTGIGSVNSDVLLFVGYGRQSEGASFQQLSATQVQINSADGVVHDIITIPSGVSIGGIAGFVDVLQRGASGNDTINGTGRDNAIFGLDGNDTIATGDGSDVIDGGRGFDIIQAGGATTSTDSLLPSRESQMCFSISAAPTWRCSISARS